MKRMISEQLKRLGISANLLGYDYLREAIAMSIADRNYIRQITKALYPDLAVKFKTTASRVERAIRHAIERAALNAPLEEWSKVFINSVSAERGKATNSEFIAGVVDYIMLENENRGNTSQNI